MKNRRILSLLMALALVYFAVPYLPKMGMGLSSWFSLFWLVFAILVIGGNLSSLMFSHTQQLGTSRVQQKQPIRKGKRARQY